jgi:dTMP kinase
MAKGKFITFEGGEGAGKSTQARLLCERLEEAGRRVVRTREPGGTPGAEFARHMLKSGAMEPYGPFAEAVVLSAARDDHVTAVIAPALNRGEWVVCDRFSDSTRAYQGAAGGVDDKVLDALETLVSGETRPDLTIVLDAPAEQALARARERASDEGKKGDRFEDEALEFHHKLRAAFIEIAKRNKRRCFVFDTTQPAERVSEAIWKLVSKKLKP